MPKLPNGRHVHGPAIRALREAKGISLESLALAAQVDSGNLSRVERGDRKASLDVIARIANALEVPAEAISYVATINVVSDEAVA